MTEATFVEAINKTLARAMREDERVIVLGEDVAEGGPYLVTAGLADEFGRERVRNTPISEGAVCGVAVGAAQAGLKPVVEIMFIDFITLALDQLVNQAAKAHFMSGGQLNVPLVLRTQGGSGQRNGAQHSQSLEAWLTHIPGLKVVMPGSAADAAGLLLSAIADPNPVVFVENKSLYFRGREPVPDPPEPIPLGRATTLREGRDVTIVALSRLVGDAMEAAERLAANDGIEAEVIDPRTLVPLDLETLAQSVRRTGPGDRRPRGGRAPVGSEPSSPPNSRRPRSTTSRRRSSASARRTRRFRSARRSRTPTVPGRGDRTGCAVALAWGEDDRALGPRRDCARRHAASRLRPARAPLEREQRRAGHLLEHAALAEHDLEIGERQPRVLAGDALGARALARWRSPRPATCWRWATIRISRDSGS